MLFFNRAYPPSDQATAILLHQLAESLRKQFDIRISSEPMTLLSRYRLLSYLIYAVAGLFRAFFAKRSTLAVIWSDPPMFNCALGAVFRIRGIPYVQVIQDLYPEVLFRTNILRRDGILGSLLANIQKLNLAHAERVVAISPDMAEVLHQDYSLDRKKVLVIQNWSPISLPRSGAPQEQTHATGETTDKKTQPFVVKYAGNLGVGFDCNMIVEIARTLGSRTDIALVIQGSGRYLWRVKELAQQFPCVHVAERVDTKDVATSLQEADAFLLPTPSHLAGALFPSKIYAYAALGRPVIISAPSQSYLHALIKEHEFGFSSLCTEVEKLVGHITALAALKQNSPEEYWRIATNGFHYTSSVWNRQTAATRYAELFREIGVATVKGQVLDLNLKSAAADSNTPRTSGQDDVKKSS